MPRQIHPTPFVIKPPNGFVEKHPELRRWSHAISLQFAGGVQKQEGLTAVVTDEALQAMGSALWNALPQESADEFDRALEEAGATILPIIIETDQAAEQALSWETLYHPKHGFLGRHTGFTLSRRTRKPTGLSPNPDKGPLRVLLFTSLPDDVDPEHGRLNVEEEQIQVQEALMPWISKGLIELEIPDDGRFSTLQALLDSFHPHVLFLSGHGKFHHEPHAGEPPYGEFLFEGESGASQPVKEDEIARALVGMGVQLVVLSACESGKAASDALANGLMQRLSAQGIPHVIGMRESIYDTAGTKFEHALCGGLARQEHIGFALQAARLAIQTPFKDIFRRETELRAEEELSFGQWCLPVLLSPNPASPLIDWDFPPREIQARYTSKSLSTIMLPPRFVGRRAEIRKYKGDMLKGRVQKLLITGPGGQGKTSLAGKLALDLQARGYRVFAWSARPENPWRDFEFNLELALDEPRSKKYDRFRARFETETERAGFMLDLLMAQFAGRVLFFVDNLESIQDPETRGIADKTIAAWIQAARAAQGLILLATSRWALPDWDGEQLHLSRASYGDFLQMAQQLALRGQLQKSFLNNRRRLREVYDALAGNSRGLEFFAAATLVMESDEEDAFLQKLSQVKGELQANMAIEAIYTRLPDSTKTFLSRLPAYQEPVPAEGLLKLGLDLSAEPSSLLNRLLAVSLLEAHYEPDYEVIQFQCSPLVADWLRQRDLLDEDPRWLDAAADYHLYLRRHERRTLSQTLLTHRALGRAGRGVEADRLALDYVVGPYTRAGLYMTLLIDWLPSICHSQDLSVQGEALGQTGKLLHHLGDYETALTYLKQSLAIRQQIGDKAGEGTTLNNISQIFDAQGDYETALTYLKQSLAIRQQIGDKAGLCATLFNMGHIHAQNKQIEEAVQAWVTVYVLAKQINEYQALQALSKLAPQLGLPEGLSGWEMLAQRQ